MSAKPIEVPAPEFSDHQLRVILDALHQLAPRTAGRDKHAAEQAIVQVEAYFHVEQDHQPEQDSRVFLTFFKQYDVSNLRFIRWSNDDPAETVGYNVADYFNSNGLYMGPDIYGIEPIFAPTEDA